ncbi:MAG: ROK family protein [Bacteroidetes bacterium]|nr:MAG: ROK family protein [Bacteroidota bacterium]
MKSPNSISVLGIDLGGTKVAAGKIIHGVLQKQMEMKINASSEDYMDTVLLISELIGSLRDESTEGIGIGVPGLVDREKGVVFDVLNIPSWKEVPLKTLLENKFNIPVTINNDSNCFALGEYQYGTYAGTNDFVGITIGTGMGSGIIKNGAIMPDAHCCSGEFGTMPYLDGIYENYSSGMFFLREFNLNGEEVAIAADRGESWAIEAYEQFGIHLGNAIKTIKMAVDPALIVIGGSVAKASYLFEESMWKSVTDFAFPSALEGFMVKFTQTPNIAILGAAALCITPSTH